MKAKSLEKYEKYIPKCIISNISFRKIQEKIKNIECMMCRNIVNIETGYKCEQCKLPLCLQCFQDFQKKEVSVNYELPCGIIA